MTKLKEMRLQRGISQSQLAAKSGVDVRVLQSYEQGLRKIDGAKIQTLLSLATALECKISDIVENPELMEELKNNGY